MARRMIPVRHRETGQETTVSEQAYGYFAGHYERLDQQPQDGAEKPQEPANPSPEGAPAPDASETHTRRTAAKTKE